MSAIVLLDQDWYGAIHSWQDTKNTDKTKSSLMLTVFTPGTDTIQNIITKSKTQQLQQGNQQRNLPVKSYSKGCIVWYRQENLIVNKLFPFRIGLLLENLGNSNFFFLNFAFTLLKINIEY